MFEKLFRLRAEYNKSEIRLLEAQKKFDEVSARLKEAEQTEILNLVYSQKLTPEELADLFGIDGKVSVPTAESKGKEPKKETEEVIPEEKTAELPDDEAEDEVLDETDENEMEDLLNEDY
jgi:hypothetical protein